MALRLTPPEAVEGIDWMLLEALGVAYLPMTRLDGLRRLAGQLGLPVEEFRDTDSEAAERVLLERLRAVLPWCRVCGCTDDIACDEGCSWVEPDLCSACVTRGSGPGVEPEAAGTR